MILKKLLSLCTLFILPYMVYAGSWHSDLTHRPRVLLTSTEIENIRSRLGSYPYSNLWYNDYSTFSSIYTNGRRAVDSTENTLENPRTFTDERSKIAKDAAFVYVMNKHANGIHELNDSTNANNPWNRTQYQAHALDYLVNLDPMVNGPDNISNLFDRAPFINNWQHRSEELIFYCQAYDLLLGAGLIPDSTIEARIGNLANNLLNRYTAHLFIAQYFLQRNNHKLILAAALGTAAVTINHHEQAENWINAAMVIIEWVLFAEPEEALDGFRQIDSDGGYAEGPVYLRYAWQKMIPFFIALRNFNGDWEETYSIDSLNIFYPNDASLKHVSVQSPWYDSRYSSVYDWVSKIRQPEGRLPGIEDSPLNVYFPELAIMGSYYSWPYDSYTDDYTKETILNNYLGNLKADYICAGNAKETASPIEWGNIQYLPEAGNLVFRNDWSTDAIYFHLNGKHGVARQAAAAHDQADVSHFTIGYKGKLFAMDAGYGGWADRYAVNKPENHNTILVNGFGPAPPSGPTFYLDGVDLILSVGDASPVDGYFQNLFADDHFAYCELTSNYGQSYTRFEEYESLSGQEMWLLDENDSTNVEFTRAVVFVDNCYFVMLDQIDNQNNDSLEYTWQLHVNGGGDTGGSFQSLPDGGIIIQEDAKLRTFVTALDNLDSLMIDSSHHADGYGPENLVYHSMIKAVKNGIDTHYLSVFFPYEEYAPGFIPFSSKEYTGLVVDRTATDENRYEILLFQNADSLIIIPAHSIDTFKIPAIQTRTRFLVISIDSSSVNPGPTYLYGTGSDTVLIDGTIYALPVLAISQDAHYPRQINLHPAYPNPFNSSTAIEFELSEDSFITLSIFDIMGREVVALERGQIEAGFHKIKWNGMNRYGKHAGAGVYFYRLQTLNYTATKKMILLK